MVNSPVSWRTILLRFHRLLAAVLLIATAATAASLYAQQNSAAASAAANPPVVDPSLYSAMRWRLIGPYRAGRVSAVAGVPGDPSHLLHGHARRRRLENHQRRHHWKPIFDAQHVASIGDIAIAPSESQHHHRRHRRTNRRRRRLQLHRCRRHLDQHRPERFALHQHRHQSIRAIPTIIVVGVLGHPILGVGVPSENRGVYKTTDGGKTWTKSLYKDDMAGVSNMAADPDNPRILYAGLWKPFDFRTGPPDSRHAGFLDLQIHRRRLHLETRLRSRLARRRRAAASVSPSLPAPKVNAFSPSWNPDFSAPTMAAPTGARSPKTRASPAISTSAASTSTQKCRHRLRHADHHVSLDRWRPEFHCL